MIIDLAIRAVRGSNCILNIFTNFITQTSQPLIWDAIWYHRELKKIVSVTRPAPIQGSPLPKSSTMRMALSKESPPTTWELEKTELPRTASSGAWSFTPNAPSSARVAGAS